MKNSVYRTFDQQAYSETLGLMENLKYQEEIKSLKALAEHYESQLKLVKIEPCDLTGSELDLLAVCVSLQEDLSIHDLKNLHEFYYERKRDYIENKLIVMQQTTGLNGLKSVITETAKDIDVLERFIEMANKRIIPYAEIQQKNNHHLATKQALLERQTYLKTPTEFNIDAIMDKIDLLEFGRSK